MRDLPLVGDEFAGYRLLSVLGRGGMSTVYRAENPRLGNVIALKVMAPDLADNDIFRARAHEREHHAHPDVAGTGIAHFKGLEMDLLFTGKNDATRVGGRGSHMPSIARAARRSIHFRKCDFCS